jgi:hypothetical protein
MTGLAVAGTTIVAVGYDAAGAVVWHSESGSSWQRVDDLDGSAAFEGARMLAVTWSGSGLVAVGHTAGADGSTNGVVWSSTDGRRWTVAERETFGGATLSAVSGSGRRVVVAGQDSVGAVIWTSDDGSTWSRVAGQADFRGAEVRGVILVDNGAIAVGTSSGRGALWSAARAS